MDWLWLTLADPDPATNGQFIYSKGLIEGAAEAGAQLSVIGVARQESRPRAPFEHGISWYTVPDRPRSKWRRLLSPKPFIATHAQSPKIESTLDVCLASRAWDAVIFDSICTGWALDRVVRHRDESPHPPGIVYLAHNHEVAVARRIAQSAPGVMRLQKEIDAHKVTRLERRLVAAADLVTSNTPEDCRSFEIGAAGRPVAFLPPGYGGPRVALRTLDTHLPRRAIVVGSFDWLPKRVSLEAFLVVATPVLDRAGIELQIVGAVEADYLASLRNRFPTVTFVGPVADVAPYMAAARIALVPDLIGGFKLKGLDYVFNRLPILAMRIALPGMPLHDKRSVGLFDDHQALADGVVALIDDFPTLNARQDRAFAACADRFDWARIGRHLVASVQQAGGGTFAKNRAVASYYSYPYDNQSLAEATKTAAVDR